MNTAVTVIVTGIGSQDIDCGIRVNIITDNNFDVIDT